MVHFEEKKSWFFFVEISVNDDAKTKLSTPKIIFTQFFREK